jgi:hypothetical protein
MFVFSLPYETLNIFASHSYFRTAPSLILLSMAGNNPPPFLDPEKVITS